MRNWLVAGLMVLLAGCATPQKDKETLYQQLGGEAGVDRLVYDLIVNIAADDRIAHRWRGVDIERFREGLETYICSISGGDCEYRGDSMRTIHAGHQYTDREFNALVETLIRTMDQRAVPVTVQNRLLAKLAPSYADVVYH